MKRIIYIITIGFIFGIIGGLFIKKVSLLFLFVILLMLFFRKKILSKNINRIINVFVKNNIIPIFLISMLFGNLSITFENYRYIKLSNKYNEKNIVAIVVSNKEETDYKYKYIIKINKFKYILKVPKNIVLNYGDKIKFDATYETPSTKRNYKGFNYQNYLKSQKIYGIFETDKLNILSNNNLSLTEIINNKIRNKIITNVRKILPEETSELCLGILIGYDNDLQENLQLYFNKSSLNHVLAISGMHINYLVLGLLLALKKLKIPKHFGYIIISFILINYLYLTQFSASVIRASVMEIMLLFSIIISRKNDTKTTISIAALIILINNPYKITDIGFILSFLATIGIIVGNKILKNKKEKNIIISYIKTNIKMCIFANLFVIPIIVYNFNTLSFTFIISNLIVGLLIGPIVIGGFLLILISFLNIKITFIYSSIYNFCLKILIVMVRITSKIPFSQILVTTPNIFFLIIYYLFLYLFLKFKIMEKYYNNRYLIKKIKKLKIKFTYITHKNFIYIIIIILIFNLFKIIPHNLVIYFIDVGQGDSTLIVTPNNKKILIDGGGADNYDVGEKVLLPYLLDRRIKTIDYIFISHFDSDHFKRINCCIK